MVNLLLILSLVVLADGAFAGEADVIDVQVSKKYKNTYNFKVTVMHSDSGWKHYANKWEIIDAEGKILGTRVLHHPHVNEQPFSRQLYDVTIPEHVKKVTVKAHDSVHGYGGKVIITKLP